MQRAIVEKKFKKKAEKKWMNSMLERTARFLSSAAPWVSTLAIFACSYFLTENRRTDISTQLQIQDRMKVELQTQAQSQMDMLEKARLELQRQVAIISSENDAKRTDADDRRTKADELRLNSDFNKALNDLVPKIEIFCTVKRDPREFIKVLCTLKNIGIYRTIVSVEDFFIVDNEKQDVVNDSIERVENQRVSAIPAGMSGNIAVNIYPNQKGMSVKLKTIRLYIKTETDHVSTSRLRKISQGYLTSAEITTQSGNFVFIDLPLD